MIQVDRIGPLQVTVAFANAFASVIRTRWQAEHLMGQSVV